MLQLSAPSTDGGQPQRAVREPAASNPLFKLRLGLERNSRPHSHAPEPTLSSTAPVCRASSCLRARRGQVLARCAHRIETPHCATAPLSFHFVHQPGSLLRYGAHPSHLPLAVLQLAHALAPCSVRRGTAFAQAAHNPSLNRTRYGKHRKPGPSAHGRKLSSYQRRPGAPPPQRRLARTLGLATQSPMLCDQIYSPHAP